MLLKLKETVSGMGKSTMPKASKLNKVGSGKYQKYPLALATRLTLFSMTEAFSVEWWGKLTGWFEG